MNNFDIFLFITCVISLSFFISNIEGPFGFFSKLRNRILNNKYLGLQFFKLMECPWCLGFHSGYIIGIILFGFSIDKIFLLGLSGSTIMALFNLIKD